MVEEARKVCFEQLRHRSACSIDELKSKLRKVLLEVSFLILIFSGPSFFALVANLNLQAQTHSRTCVAMSLLTIDTTEWIIAALRQGLEGQKGESSEGQEGYQCD